MGIAWDLWVDQWDGWVASGSRDGRTRRLSLDRHHPQGVLSEGGVSQGASLVAAPGPSARCVVLDVMLRGGEV